MLNVDAVTATNFGLSVLLITGVVTWKQCLGESVAWDTLTWFAALIAMAGYLNKYGLISWFSQTVVKFCCALGTPPYLGAMVLAFVSNLMGGLTPHGIGSAPVFYGPNYVPLAK
ncbi:dityrosine synthesis enzyme [Orobanche minor]